MRFFWLAISIVTPLIFVHLIEAESNKTISNTYLAVAAAFLIFSIALTVAGFIKHRNNERHAESRRLLEERDHDIAKWRKAFFSETADLYDAQKTMLTKARELGQQHATYSSASFAENHNEKQGVASATGAH